MGVTANAVRAMPMTRTRDGITMTVCVTRSGVVVTVPGGVSVVRQILEIYIAFGVHGGAISRAVKSDESGPYSRTIEVEPLYFTRPPNRTSNVKPYALASWSIDYTLSYGIESLEDGTR